MWNVVVSDVKKTGQKLLIYLMKWDRYKLIFNIIEKINCNNKQFCSNLYSDAL